MSFTVKQGCCVLPSGQRNNTHFLKGFLRNLRKIHKTCRAVLKICSDEHKERIKHGYLATKPTGGPAGLCIKERMPTGRYVCENV